MCVCVCVCVCVPSFSVQDAATFSPRTRETSNLLSCCKKLSSLERRLISSSGNQQKPVVCRKVRFKMLRSGSPVMQKCVPSKKDPPGSDLAAKTGPTRTILGC